MITMKLVKEKQTLAEILQSVKTDVTIEERVIILIRERPRDEFAGWCIYHWETNELESGDGDTYSLETVYDKHKWLTKTDLVVWQDLTKESEPNP